MGPGSTVRWEQNRAFWKQSPDWRRQKEIHAEKYLIPTVKYGGGSLMLWGCFSSKGPGQLVRIHGIMDSIKYQQILNQNLTASARKLKLSRGWIFQQDNEPMHTSKSTQKWFTDHRIKVLPLSSHGIYPIENLWHELKRRVHKCGPWNLERFCMEEWSPIPCRVFSNLIMHFRRSCYLGRGRLHKCWMRGC